MNVIIKNIILLVLIIFLGSVVFMDTFYTFNYRCPTHDHNDPREYCLSEEIEKYCDRKQFCREFRNQIGCNKGPEEFCKTKELSELCREEALCLTWPDDSVTAVKMTSPRSWWEDE